MAEITTSTERLRKLLDERSVEWRAYTDQTRGAMELFYSTYFDTPNGKARVTSISDSNLVFVTFRATPEQAIAAMLGRGECEDISTQDGRFICSRCGCKVWEDAIDNGMLNYCPDCGLAVSR